MSVLICASIVAEIDAADQDRRYPLYPVGILHLPDRDRFPPAEMYSNVVATVAAPFVEVMLIFPAAMFPAPTVTDSIHKMNVKPVPQDTGVVPFIVFVVAARFPDASRYTIWTVRTPVPAEASFADVDTTYSVCPEVGVFMSAWLVSRYSQASPNTLVLDHPCDREPSIDHSIAVFPFTVPSSGAAISGGSAVTF